MANGKKTFKGIKDVQEASTFDSATGLPGVVPTTERSPAPDWLTNQTRERAYALSQQADIDEANAARLKAEQESHLDWNSAEDWWSAASAGVSNAWQTMRGTWNFFGGRTYSEGRRPTEDEALAAFDGLEGIYLENALKFATDVDSMNMAADIERKRQANDAALHNSDWLPWIGGQVAGAVADPVNWAIALSTGGLGLFGTAGRQAARIAGRSFLSRAAEYGAIGGAQGLLYANITAPTTPYDDAMEYAMGGLAGAAFGVIGGEAGWHWTGSRDAEALASRGFRPRADGGGFEAVPSLPSQTPSAAAARSGIVSVIVERAQASGTPLSLRGAADLLHGYSPKDLRVNGASGRVSVDLSTVSGRQGSTILPDEVNIGRAVNDEPTLDMNLPGMDDLNSVQRGDQLDLMTPDSTVSAGLPPIEKYQAIRQSGEAVFDLGDDLGVFPGRDISALQRELPGLDVAVMEAKRAKAEAEAIRYKNITDMVLPERPTGAPMASQGKRFKEGFVSDFRKTEAGTLALVEREPSFDGAFKAALTRAGKDVPDAIQRLDVDVRKNALSKLQKATPEGKPRTAKNPVIERPVEIEQNMLDDGMTAEQLMKEFGGEQTVELDLGDGIFGQIQRDMDFGITDVEIMSSRDLDGNPLTQTTARADAEPAPFIDLDDLLEAEMPLGGVDKEWIASIRENISKMSRDEELSLEIPGIRNTTLEAPLIEFPGAAAAGDRAGIGAPSEAAPGSAGAAAATQSVPTSGAIVNPLTLKMVDQVNMEGAPSTSKSIKGFRGGATKLSKGEFLAASNNPLTRWLYGKLAPQVIGKSGDETVVAGTARELASMDRKKFRVWEAKTLRNGYGEWARAQGLSMFQAMRTRRMRDFSMQLSKTYRGEIAEGVNPVLDRIAKDLDTHFRSYMDEYAKRGVDWAVELKTRFDADPTLRYAPRKYSFNAMQLGYNRHGLDMADLFGGAMKSGYEKLGRPQNLSDEKWTKIGQAYVESVIGARVSNGGTTRTVASEQGREILAGRLRAENLPDDLIDDILSDLVPDATPAGSGPYFNKRRTILDEGYSQGDLAITDFLDHDMWRMVNSYTNQAIGDLRLRDAGFERGYASAMEQAMAGTEGLLGNLKHYSPETAKAERLNLEAIIKHIAGVPRVENPNSAGQQTARILQNWVYSAYMGGLGWAQIAEIGPILHHSGATSVAKQLPALKEIGRVLRSGNKEAKDAMTRDMMSWGIGVERDGHTMVVLYQDADRVFDIGDSDALARHDFMDDGMARNGRLMDKLERASQMASSVTSVASGGLMMTDTLRILGGRTAIQNLSDMAAQGAIGRRSLMSKKANKAFEATMGMDDATLQKIAPLINKHFERGGFGGVKKINIDKIAAEDQAVADIIRNYAVRRANRAVIEVGPEQLPLIHDTSAMARVALQFRSFPIAAQVAHLYHAMGNGNVSYIMPALLFSAALATMQTKARVWFQTMGLSDERRQEIWDQRFGAEDDDDSTRVMKTSYTVANQMSISGLMPTVVTTLMAGADVTDEQFAYARQSGLSGSIFDLNGTPVPSLVSGVIKTLGEARDEIKDPEGHEMTPTDWRTFRRWIPLQNVNGVQQTLNWVESQLTEPDDPNAEYAEQM